MPEIAGRGVAGFYSFLHHPGIPAVATGCASPDNIVDRMLGGGP